MKVYQQKIKYHNKDGDFPKGTIWQSDKMDSLYYFKDTPWSKYSIGSVTFLPKDFVENNPDIFEDYTNQWLLEEANRRYPKGTKFYSAMNKKTKYTSDGYYYFSKLTSQESNIFTDDCCVYYEGEWAEIVKKLLFITDDGVDIYEGDLYYLVDNPSEIINKINFRYTKLKAIDSGVSKNKSFKRFSTKEKAEEYIDLNKPKYSKQDVINAIENSEFFSGDVTEYLKGKMLKQLK